MQHIRRAPAFSTRVISRAQGRGRVRALPLKKPRRNFRLETANIRRNKRPLAIN